MSAPISRRAFLKALVPSWMTRRNLIAAGVGTALVLAFCNSAPSFRHLDFLDLLKQGGIAIGLALAIGLLLWSSTKVLKVFRKSSSDFQAVVRNIFQAIAAISFGIGVAIIYSRWRESGNIWEVLIPVTISFAAYGLDRLAAWESKEEETSGKPVAADRRFEDRQGKHAGHHTTSI